MEPEFDYYTKYDPNEDVAEETPTYVQLELSGSVLDNFVAGRSMIAWKDGEPVLVEVI